MILLALLGRCFSTGWLNFFKQVWIDVHSIRVEWASSNDNSALCIMFRLRWFGWLCSCYIIRCHVDLKVSLISRLSIRLLFLLLDVLQRCSSLFDLLKLSVQSFLLHQVFFFGVPESKFGWRLAWFCRSILDTQYTFHLNKLRLKLRSGIMTLIYQQVWFLSISLVKLIASLPYYHSCENLPNTHR